MSDLTRLEAAAAGLESLPEDSETADYIGRLDKVIRTLQGHRKTIMDELPGPVSGSEYRITEQRWADRSYNTAGLLSKFADRGLGINHLVKLRAVELKWRWTEVKNLLYTSDIDLSIAPREIEDDGEVDGPLVGETWKSRYTVEGVK